MRVPTAIYPYGIARENTGPNSFSPNGYYPGSSLFVRMLPYLEQQVLANAYNYSLHNWVADNSTVGATGLNVLWCPSDGLIAGLHVRYAGWGWDGSDQILTYTSYAGNMGNFCKVPIHVTSPAQHQAVLNQADGLFSYLGWPQPGFPVQPNPLAPLDPGQRSPRDARIGHRRAEQHAAPSARRPTASSARSPTSISRSTILSTSAPGSRAASATRCSRRSSP